MSQFCEPCEVKEDDISDEEVVRPVDRIVTPKDVLPSIEEDDETIYIVGTQTEKVTRIIGLESMINLKVVIYLFFLFVMYFVKELRLRSCLISSMNGIETLINLEKLELYDNCIEKLSSLENLVKLKVLDISYNAIRDMSPVASCVALEEFYIAQNKLRRINGIEYLVNLKLLDIGANRIRVCFLIVMLYRLLT